MNHLQAKTQCQRVLLLEDDDLDSYAVHRALSKSTVAYQCDRARLVAEVAEFAKTNSYDVVIADMNVPDSDGLSTITNLLAILGNTPIVVLSGNDDDAIALESVHVGAQDFIPKHYISDSSLLNRTLRHAIERHHLKLGLERTRDRERFLAHYDPCTGLPNRSLFLDRISQAVGLAERNPSYEFALFFVDLDRFKTVNDAFGHSAGDTVLRTVGERMSALVRESDTVARLGGDEFVLILNLADDLEALNTLANDIINVINQPIQHGHHKCSVGASIGISCFPEHGNTPEQLIQNADLAMYEAKKNGRNLVQFFTQDLFDQQSRSFNIEKALLDALQAPNEHFTLAFQPRVELASTKTYSVEALIRWHHEKLGFISPAHFIPLAEDLGLIEKIDEWVLEAACQKLSRWSSEGANVVVAVNISGRSFNRRRFVTDIVEPMIKKYEIDGRYLELEITESALLTDTQHLIERLETVKSLGVSLAIDDFGTGFSSLNYLNRLPIDTLKIDGSFICDKNSEESKKALLKAIIALGEALQMDVIAECVETQSQSEYLKALGCYAGQGYYWAKPDEAWEPQINSVNTPNSKLNTVA